MERINKNVKISEKHHQILKEYCDKNGLKMYRVIEKWIDSHISGSRKYKKEGVYDE